MTEKVKAFLSKVRGLERWRGTVDEKLRTIEEDTKKILKMLDTFDKGYDEHEKAIGRITTLFENCQSRHEVWIKEHDAKHTKNEEAATKKESENKDISAKKLAAIISGLAVILSTIVQFALKRFGF